MRTSASVIGLKHGFTGCLGSSTMHKPTSALSWEQHDSSNTLPSSQLLQLTFGLGQSVFTTDYGFTTALPCYPKDSLVNPPIKELG